MILVRRRRRSGMRWAMRSRDPSRRRASGGVGPRPAGQVGPHRLGGRSSARATSATRSSGTRFHWLDRGGGDAERGGDAGDGAALGEERFEGRVTHGGSLGKSSCAANPCDSALNSAEAQATSTARKSLTLVSVGPVTTRSPSAVEHAVAVMRRPAPRAGRARRPRARASVSGAAIAPAASAPCRRCRRCRAISAQMPGAPSSATRAGRAGIRCCARRARRAPAGRVTVVSPPESSTQGARQRLPMRGAPTGDAGQRPCRAPRASPSSASPRISGREAQRLAPPPPRPPAP